MVVSAQHFKEVTNGYEKTTSGLWTHKGKLDSGGLRATQSLQPNNGAGVEIGFAPSAPIGYIYSIDRDAGAWRDLQIVGRSLTLSPTGGTLNLPPDCITSGNIVDSSIGTADIAGGAVQAWLANYSTVTSWTIGATVNTWLESAAQASFTSGGGLLRIDFCASLTCPAGPGAIVLVGVGIDGGLGFPSLQAAHIPGAGYWVPMAGCVYASGVTAGAHRASLWVYANTANSGFTANAYTTLNVTEQKR